MNLSHAGQSCSYSKYNNRQLRVPYSLPSKPACLLGQHRSAPYPPCKRVSGPMANVPRDNSTFYVHVHAAAPKCPVSMDVFCSVRVQVHNTLIGCGAVRCKEYMHGRCCNCVCAGDAMYTQSSWMALMMCACMHACMRPHAQYRGRAAAAATATTKQKWATKD